MSDFDVCKMLINTDNFNKDKSPYILTTAIDLPLKDNTKYLEFEYKKIYNRETKYKDVIGFYYTSKNASFNLSAVDIETMGQWVRCLGKSLICLIECDGVINSWLFNKDVDGQVSHIEVKADSANNVNYYVWTEPTPAFWGNADFLIHGEGLIEEDEGDPVGTMLEKLDSVEAGVASILLGMDSLTSVIQNLITVITKEDEPRE